MRDNRDEPSVLSRLKDRLAPIVSLKTLGGAAFSMVLIGIVANAVWFQKGRHPAPLFATGLAEPGLPETPPLPLPRPQPVAAADPAGPESAGAVTAAAAEAPVESTASVPVRTVPTKTVASKPHRDDGIARLLLGQPLASDTGPMAGSNPSNVQKPDAALLATQRQLARLGYPVKPDGRMSTAMRGAIEAFERKQHIQAENDAITPKLRREIAAAVAASTEKAQ